MKTCKKATGGKIDGKLVDQHKRMAQGLMGTVNKASEVMKKGGSVKKGKK